MNSFPFKHYLLEFVTLFDVRVCVCVCVCMRGCVRWCVGVCILLYSELDFTNILKTVFRKIFTKPLLVQMQVNYGELKQLNNFKKVCVYYYLIIWRIKETYY